MLGVASNKTCTLDFECTYLNMHMLGSASNATLKREGWGTVLFCPWARGGSVAFDDEKFLPPWGSAGASL